MLANIFYFLIVIGILVIVHEWGHYAAARATGMRADIFSFGMGRRLFGWNKRTGFTFGSLPLDFQFDGLTDWRVCLFPIGGYVKVAGMIDESFDNDHVIVEPKPWEFRSKNTFQKALVLSAGVIMNFILAVLIYGGIALFNGETSWETTEVAFVRDEGIADLIGIQNGDKIISINGKEINTWSQFLQSASMDNFGGNYEVVVNRDGETHTLNADNQKILEILTDQSNLEKGLSNIIGAEPANIKVFFSQILSTSPADKLGLLPGDTVIAVNGEYIVSSGQFIDIVQSSGSNIMMLKWKRGERIINAPIKSDKENRIGVLLQMDYTGPVFTRDFTIIESLQKGFDDSIGIINIIFKSFGQIFKGNIEVKEAVAGPIMIAKQSGRTAELGLEYFLSFLGGLSLSLALINILPLPALDGGHLLMVIIEGIIRRELPVKTKLIIQNIGMILLLGLMVFIVFIDLTR